MILPLSIATIVVFVLLLWAAYRMGYNDGLHHGIEQSRVHTIKATHKAWRVGMLAERERLSSPSSTSKE